MVYLETFIKICIMIKINQIDRNILRQLSLNSEQPVRDIAKKVELSVSPVHERIKKMESSGLIQRYSAIVDPKKMGLEVLAYIQIKFLRHSDELFDDFMKHIEHLHEVQEAVFTAGEYDVMIKVYLKNMDDYNNFILNRLPKLDNISNVKSSFGMKSIIGGGVSLNPETILHLK